MTNEEDKKKMGEQKRMIRMKIREKTSSMRIRQKIRKKKGN